MSDDKVPAVRYEPALISEEDCEPRIGFIPFQDGDWVSFADYEAAIARAEAEEALLRECYEWLFESKCDGPRVSEGALTNGSYTREFHDLHERLSAAISAQQTNN